MPHRTSAALAGLLTEAVTHPGVMAVALLDTPGISTGSVELAQDLRRLNMLFTTKFTDLMLAAVPCRAWGLILECL